MKLTLMVEGSPAVISAILASLPDGATAATLAAPISTPVVIPPMPGAPVAAIAPQPTPAMPTAATGGDEDEGPVNAVADGAVDINGLPWDERIHAKTKAITEAGAWRRRRGIDDATVAAVEAELRARSAPPIPIQPAPVAVAPQPIPQQPVAMPTVPMQPMAQPAPLPVAAPSAPVSGAPAAMAYPVAGAAPVQSDPAAIPPMPAMAPAPIPQPVAQPAPAMPTADQINTAVAQATGTLDFAQFMQHLSGQMAKTDGAGMPLIHTDYLAGITAEISQAFQTPLNAITDIAANPNMITYAVQCIQRDQRW